MCHCCIAFRPFGICIVDVKQKIYNQIVKEKILNMTNIILPRNHLTQDSNHVRAWSILKSWPTVPLTLACSVLNDRFIPDFGDSVYLWAPRDSARFGVLSASRFGRLDDSANPAGPRPEHRFWSRMIRERLGPGVSRARAARLFVARVLRLSIPC